MSIRRKYEGWGTRPRFKWEDENKILIIGVGEVPESEKQQIATYIQGLLDKFGLSFGVEVVASGSHLTTSIRKVLQSSLSANQLDSDSALADLNKQRKEDLSLRPAVVVKVNPSEYKFTDPKAIYGVGEPDGLVILRFAHEEAVIHEMGHMLGIGSHCQKSPDCVMKWECPSKNFCESCAARLKALWCYTELQ